jgi:DNA replication protein DnaC
MARRALPNRPCRNEIASGRRRIERHFAEARLPPGKTVDRFDFDAVPILSKAQVMARIYSGVFRLRRPGCRFRSMPAGDSDAKPATVPI